ncbi:MAG: LysM peptidoglycan-binding domain-containing protein [Anaerolineales bacterium]|nr:LysM peptidoglycan-binding domain-containing protein [Anaerolineales bacterium]
MVAEKKSIIFVLIVFALAILSFFLVSISKHEKDNQPIFSYEVRSDDTCGKIAADLNVSVLSIIESNNLQKDCNDIYTGRVLLIPYPTPTPRGSSGQTNVEIVVDCERSTYLVKKDDTLASIATEYKVPKEAISFFNGLTENKIYTSMELVIPLCYITPTP